MLVADTFERLFRKLSRGSFFPTVTSSVQDSPDGNPSIDNGRSAFIDWLCLPLLAVCCGRDKTKGKVRFFSNFRWLPYPLRLLSGSATDWSINNPAVDHSMMMINSNWTTYRCCLYWQFVNIFVPTKIARAWETSGKFVKTSVIKNIL